VTSSRKNLLNSILAIIFIVILSFPNVFRGNQVTTFAAPLYERSIRFSNTGAGAAVQTNYQIRYIFNTATLISTSKMRSDCADIRVKDTNRATDLSFWLESGCNSATTILWIKVPTINTGPSSKVIYLQYGDPALVSTADPSLTMEKYEDMQTTPTCTLKNNAFYDSINKWVRLTNATTGLQGQCEYNYNPGSGFYTQYEFWSGGGSGADGNWLYAYNNSTPAEEDLVTGGYHFTMDEYEDRACFTKSVVSNGTGINCSTQTTLDNSAWRTAEFYHSGVNGTIILNGTTIVNANDGSGPIAKTGNFFGVGSRTGGLDNEHRIRKLFVAKFSPNVSWVTGAEVTVISTLAFAIRNTADTAVTNTCDLGTANLLTRVQCSYRIKVTSNSASGYVVNVQTSNNGLYNGVLSMTNAAAGTGGAGGNLIDNTTTGTERYGVLINPGIITGGTIARNSIFDAGATNSVNFDYVSPTTLVTATGPNLPNTTDTTRTILVSHNLNIRVSTAAGTYTQSITYTALPIF